MGRKTLVLIRHGTVDPLFGSGIPTLYGPDEPLNDHGKKESTRLARHLAENGILPTKIYTSSFERARETAALVSETLPNHPPVIRDDHFNGTRTPQWDHRPATEFGHMGNDLFADNPALPELHGETLGQVYDRVTCGASQLKQVNGDETIAVVSHGEILGMITHYLTHGEHAKPATDPQLEKGEALVLRLSPEGRIIDTRFFTPEGPILSKERMR